MQQTKDLSLALMNALNSKGSEERFSDQVEDLKTTTTASKTRKTFEEDHDNGDLSVSSCSGT